MDMQTFITSLVASVIPVIALWLQLKYKAEELRKHTKETTEEIKEDVAAVHQQLNGRIDQFLVELEKRVSAAYNKGVADQKGTG